jgi:hypothetical protein
VSTRVVLVPGTLALLPEYAGLDDPVADLRAACLRAVAWLGSSVEVVASSQGRRVAEHLLAAAPARDGDHPSYLVVGNGSACRTEKAPGHLDERAHGFDDGLRAALTTPDPEALAVVDPGLADELWADTGGFARLAELVPADATVTVDLDDDPFGVQYWVLRWEG